MYIWFFLRFSKSLLTSSRHDFVLPLVLLLVLLLMALLPLPVCPLFQLCLLVDGPCERVLLGVHLQGVLIVRNLWMESENFFFCKQEWQPLLPSVSQTTHMHCIAIMSGAGCSCWLTRLSREEERVWISSMFLQASRRFRTLYTLL